MSTDIGSSVVGDTSCGSGTDVGGQADVKAVMMVVLLTAMVPMTSFRKARADSMLLMSDGHYCARCPLLNLDQRLHHGVARQLFVRYCDTAD